MPTINQDNGTAGPEPTETLMTYRSDKVLRPAQKSQGKVISKTNFFIAFIWLMHSIILECDWVAVTYIINAIFPSGKLQVYFGQNLVCKEFNTEGKRMSIKVGDPVYVHKLFSSCADAAA